MDTSKNNLDEESNDEKYELDEPSNSGIASNFYNVESSAPKRTLHGLTYQLRLLMLFVQRVPDGQEFYLSTEMHEAGLFDDIVLKYLKDGIWRYRFLQAKHKNDETYKIKKIDLFNKKSKSKKKSQSSKNVGETKPYLLKKYFESYCAIKENTVFNNAKLEEFLICTNVGFDDEAMTYFKCTKGNDNDPILGKWVDFQGIHDKEVNPVKVRLRKEKIPELKEDFRVNCQNKNYFSNFLKKFRFLINYEDNELNENIDNCLKKCLKIGNVDLANAYLQSCVLKWFESYKDNKSKYWHIKDKEEFLKTLENYIDTLLVAGYSNFYIEELKSYGLQFENILPLHEFFAQKRDKIMFIITASPKLSVIKLSQLFEELELKQDEFIFTNADQLTYNKKIFTTFFSEPSYKWLVIEYYCNEIILDREMLNKIIKLDNTKMVVIIGQEYNILNFNKCLRLKMPCFDDKNNSFMDLTVVSQEEILKKPVIFQGEIIILNELIDIYSGRNIIDKLTLEKLLSEKIKIGNNDAFVSEFFIEDCYIRRKLTQKELNLDILQNEEVLKSCLFIISGIDREQLKNLNINNKWIYMWEDGKTFHNGIILSTLIDSNSIFNQLCKDDTKDICLLEYINGSFLIIGINPGTDIFRKHFIWFEEDDLNKKQILEKKIIIVADGPGRGKSMFMTRVARQLKQIISNIWVLRCNLSFYAYKQKEQRRVMKSLEDIDFIDNEIDRAIEFMADLLFPQENENQNKHFVKELLTQSLDCLNGNKKFPKIILLFDGFDEISPTFKERTLTLLKALLNSNVAQMWITTRNHEELSLEEALHSSSFSFKPLDFTEKVDFLQKLWKYNLMNFDNINPKPDTKDVSTFFTEITNNICNWNVYSFENSFLNFKNYWHYTPNYSLPIHNYSQLQLFLSGINFSVIAKHLIYHFEYYNEENMSEFTENPLQIKMMAEIIFFTKFSSLDKLDLFSLYEEFIKYKWTIFRDDKDAAGLSVAGRNSFKRYLEYLTTYHQDIAFKNLFRPYDNNQVKKESDKIELSRAGLLVILDDRLEFVHRSFAEYFASNYFAEHFQCEDVQKIVFSDVLMKDDYALIRKFLNNNETFLDKLSFKTQQMNEIIKVNSSLPLNQMLIRQLYNLFEKFLENLPLDLVKNNILFNENPFEETVLHRICQYMNDEQLLGNLLKAIKDSVSSETLIELFFKKDFLQNTALHSINFGGHISIVKQKLQFFKLNCTSKLFYELLLQINGKGQTILHIACDCGKDISDLLDVSNENRDAIRELLLKIDNNGQTALFNTIRYSNNTSLLTTLLKLVKSVCNSEEINYLFSIQNNSRNLLHTIYKRNKYTLVNFLNAIKDHKEIVQTLLLETNEDGLSELHYTVRNFFDLDRLKIVLDFVNLNYSTETLHTILCKVTLSGKTILHMAVENFKMIDGPNWLTTLLTYLFNLVDNHKDIFIKLLLTGDENRQTILHYTSSQLKYPFLLKELIDFLQINCGQNILNELFLKLDNDKANILHFVCGQNDEHNLIFLLNNIKDNTEILNELLLQTDIEGDTLLHYTVRYCDNPSLLKILFDFVKKYDSKILNTLLLEESFKGCTLLHFACKHNNEESLKYLLYAMQDNIALRDILILKADHNGQTILHYSVDNFQMLKFFLDFVKSQCDQEMFTKLILKCDQEGHTGLHKFCQISHNEEILTYLLNSVKDNTTPDVFNTFLSIKDGHGKVASDYIAQKTNNSILLEVLSNFDL